MTGRAIICCASSSMTMIATSACTRNARACRRSAPSLAFHDPHGFPPGRERRVLKRLAPDAHRASGAIRASAPLSKRRRRKGLLFRRAGGAVLRHDAHIMRAVRGLRRGAKFRRRGEARALFADILAGAAARFALRRGRGGWFCAGGAGSGVVGGVAGWVTAGGLAGCGSVCAKLAGTAIRHAAAARARIRFMSSSPEVLAGPSART